MSNNFTKEDIPEIVKEVISAINEIKEDDNTVLDIPKHELSYMSIDEIYIELNRVYYSGMIDGVKTISSILERMIK